MSKTGKYGEEAQNIYSEEVHQLGNDTCDVKAEQLILGQFGIHYTETELAQESYDHGWYHNGHSGTLMEDCGKLLELHGIPVTKHENANVFTLLNEFSQGHKVIMPVDSGELWHGKTLFEILEDYNPLASGGDHALIVSGLDISDPQNAKIVVTDPGSGDLLKEYSMTQFVDAANDANFTVISTDIAPEEFSITLEGETHVSMVGNIPYDYYLQNYAIFADIDNHPVFSQFINDIQTYNHTMSVDPDSISFSSNLQNENHELDSGVDNLQLMSFETDYEFTHNSDGLATIEEIDFDMDNNF